MSRNYDNWERLVDATLDREKLRRLARCPSIETSSSRSSISSLSTSSFNFDLPLLMQTSSDEITAAASTSSALTKGDRVVDDSVYKADGYSSVDKAAWSRRTRRFSNPPNNVIAPAIALALFRRRKPHDYFFDVPAEEDPVELQLGQLKRFSLREIQVATDNFSNSNILRKGGFGKFYRGRLANGSLVAVKRLKEERTQGGELQFLTEIEMVSFAVHRNLLRLQGFCMTPTERVLVYPFMANGSVASQLRVERASSQPQLDWAKRKHIALGSARGLAYLHDHCKPRVIHRDIKAANILLDDAYEAVVGDFGLAKFMDYKETHVTTEVCGTIGHMPPEYLSTGKLSEKTDVFGYGVMLLEIITGQRVFDLARLASDDDVMLLDWVKGILKDKKLENLVDSDIRGNYVDEEVEQLIQVALLCTQKNPAERPKMSEVVRMLEGEGLAERWEEWQKEELIL